MVKNVTELTKLLSSPTIAVTDTGCVTKFEVVIPEQERDVVADTPATPLERPGSYVLQAGSFRNYADADRMQATLAIQGIESNVQKVTIDDDSWHRVRIGPIHNLGELNRLRTRLREASVDVLVIRVGE